MAGRSRWQTFWARFNFVLVYVVGFLVFNFGPGQILILNKYFFIDRQDYLFPFRDLYFCVGPFIFERLGIVEPFDDICRQAG